MHRAPSHWTEIAFLISFFSGRRAYSVYYTQPNLPVQYMMFLNTKKSHTEKTVPVYKLKVLGWIQEFTTSTDTLWPNSSSLSSSSSLSFTLASILTNCDMELLMILRTVGYTKSAYLWTIVLIVEMRVFLVFSCICFPASSLFTCSINVRKCSVSNIVYCKGDTYEQRSMVRMNWRQAWWWGSSLARGNSRLEMNHMKGLAVVTASVSKNQCRLILVLTHCISLVPPA